ncbi:hypothetical protein GCM10023189_43340 [Nibrella saemangeumensis]|uniref:DUF7192 domain-containing protein n=1 Tax=Nibrella saemangeumensis TaxID=1084526 RepID=A0ABP8NDV4_9BACT
MNAIEFDQLEKQEQSELERKLSKEEFHDLSYTQRYAYKVRNAKFKNLSNGAPTPFELLETSTSGDYWKKRLNDQLINGNEAILNKFLEFKKTLKMDVKARGIDLDYSVYGDFVDVGRYVSGEPECMVDFAAYTQTKFLDLYINVDVEHAIAQDCGFRYYATALSVVDSLENSGYRVRVIAVNYSDAVTINCNTPYGSFYEVCCTVKAYNQPINYAYMSVVCLGATDFFKAYMHRPAKNLYCYGGCDHIEGFKPNILMQENTVYIPSLYGRNRHGKEYKYCQPEAFAFDELIQDWNLKQYLVD